MVVSGLIMSLKFVRALPKASAAAQTCATLSFWLLLGLGLGVALEGEPEPCPLHPVNRTAAAVSAASFPTTGNGVDIGGPFSDGV
jgi:hypothetical protein